MKRAAVGPSRIQGWGLIAREAVAMGETVDESPILLTARVPRDIGGHTYTLSDGRHALPCGDGVFVNHSDDPNVWPLPDLRRRVMRLIAVRDIAPGEEVTLNYG